MQQLIENLQAVRAAPAAMLPQEPKVPDFSEGSPVPQSKVLERSSVVRDQHDGCPNSEPAAMVAQDSTAPETVGGSQTES